MKVPIPVIAQLRESCGEKFIGALLAAAKPVDGGIEIGVAEYFDLKRHCRRPSRGLGDAVASLAQPIARAIDAVMGTNLQNCGGCQKRQRALNRVGAHFAPQSEIRKKTA